MDIVRWYAGICLVLVRPQC